MNVRDRFHTQIMEALAIKSDSDRSKLPLLHDEWRVGIECKINEVYRYQDFLYRCQQTHMTQVGWEPDITPALFAKLMYRDGIRIIPEYISTGDTFSKDEIGWWDNILYRSLVDNNIYNPSQYAPGWEVVNTESFIAST